MRPLPESLKNIEKPISDCFVYGLIDPTTKELKYIGQTQCGLIRINYHYRNCDRRNKTSSLLSNSKRWISNLKKQGLIFDVVYLEYCSSPEELYEAETFFIDYFKSLGCSLLNHYENLFNPGPITPEIRNKISIRTKEAMNTPEIKAACAIHALNTVAGYNKGKKFSQEFKDKISKSQQYKAWRFQLEGSEEILFGFRKAAKSFGCSASALNHLVHGRVKSVHGLKIKFWKDS